MKIKITLLSALLLGTICIPSLMADTEVKININLPLVQIKEEPAMAVIPGTYIYFIYGYEHDYFFHGGYWWRFHHNRWYRAHHYNGPWKYRKNKYVPAPFFKLSPEWRKMATTHSGIKHQDMNKNWKQWEKEKRWDKKQDKKEIKEEKQDKKDDKDKSNKDNKKSGKGRK